MADEPRKPQGAGEDQDVEAHRRSFHEPAEEADVEAHRRRSH